MKYDCNKTLDYAHERNRMCDADKNRDCSNCPLKGVGVSCYHVRFITQEHIDIVQKWSDENHEKTRAEAFFEMFPKAILNGDGLPQTCFNDLVNILDECSRDCDICWNELYAGEFEKAREEEK